MAKESRGFLAWLYVLNKLQLDLSSWKKPITLQGDSMCEKIVTALNLGFLHHWAESTFAESSNAQKAKIGTTLSHRDIRVLAMKSGRRRMTGQSMMQQSMRDLGIKKTSLMCMPCRSTGVKLDWQQLFNPLNVSMVNVLARAMEMACYHAVDHVTRSGSCANVSLKVVAGLAFWLLQLPLRIAVMPVAMMNKLTTPWRETTLAVAVPVVNSVAKQKKAATLRCQERTRTLLSLLCAFALLVLALDGGLATQRRRLGFDINQVLGLGETWFMPEWLSKHVMVMSTLVTLSFVAGFLRGVSTTSSNLRFAFVCRSTVVSTSTRRALRQPIASKQTPSYDSAGQNPAGVASDAEPARGCLAWLSRRQQQRSQAQDSFEMDNPAGLASV